ncbi:unnamed protein product, partial [Staurois parvus]
MMSGSDILFTTIHVITDWPISDHMNRDLTYSDLRFAVSSRHSSHRCRALPGSAHRQWMWGGF